MLEGKAGANSTLHDIMSQCLLEHPIQLGDPNTEGEQVGGTSKGIIAAG